MTMASLHQPQQIVSDAAVRRFLLAQLSANEQSAFEKTLLASSHLEQRVKLAELELIDDYGGDRLTARERTGFHQKFLVTTNRQKQLEVSIALRNSLGRERIVQAVPSAQRIFDWPQLTWRIAFATLALVVLFASALVIRREPQIVRKLIPKRLRPAAVAMPTPDAAHHSTNLPEPSTHRDEATPLPAHEAAPQMMLLRPAVTADNAPVLTLAQNNSANLLRLELLMERIESATFSIVVATSSGEVVHKVPEMPVKAADRIDFDVQLERMKAGDFQVTLTRLTGEPGVARTYYFRVQ